MRIKRTHETSQINKLIPEHLGDVDGDGGGGEVHDEGEDEVLGDEGEVEAGGRQELLHDEHQEHDQREEQRDAQGQLLLHFETLD